MLKKRNKKGQSTLEYIILITAVIVVVIGLVVSKTGPFQKAVNGSYNTGINKITNMTARWNAGV